MNKYTESYQTDRCKYFTHYGASSMKGKTETGVPEKSVMGPLLFLVFINDIIFKKIDHKIISYADNTAI